MNIEDYVQIATVVVAMVAVVYNLIKLWMEGQPMRMSAKRVKNIKPIINLWDKRAPGYTMSAYFYMMMLPK